MVSNVYLFPYIIMLGISLVDETDVSTGSQENNSGPELVEGIQYAHPPSDTRHDSNEVIIVSKGR